MVDDVLVPQPALLIFEIVITGGDRAVERAYAARVTTIGNVAMTFLYNFLYLHVDRRESSGNGTSRQRCHLGNSIRTR